MKNTVTCSPDGVNVNGKSYTWTGFGMEYGDLLTWEEAEKMAGRRLDWYNNYDCCTYTDCLIIKVKETERS